MLVTEPAEAEVVRRIYEGVLARTNLSELALRHNSRNRLVLTQPEPMPL